MPTVATPPPPTTAQPTTTTGPTEPPTTYPGTVGPGPPLRVTGSGFTTTLPPLPATEIEVLSTNVELANEVRDNNVSFAASLAAAAGVPAWRVRVLPHSWEPGFKVLRPPSWSPQGDQMALTQSSRCDCRDSRKKLAASAVDGSKLMTVEEYNHLADMGLVEPSRGPPARVQMLTQDPCLAKLLREHTASYRQHLAHFVGVPDHYLVVMAPYMESDASGPAPSPAGAASAAALLDTSDRGGCRLPHELDRGEGLLQRGPAPASSPAAAVPAPGVGAIPAIAATMAAAPGPATAAGPVPAPGPAPPPQANRAEIAVWSVIVAPPNMTFNAPRAADHLRMAVNTKGGPLAYLLPLTLARVPDPGLIYPGFPRFDLPERKLPPPEDESVPLGFNPGGLRSGAIGTPNGDSMTVVEAQAETALRDGMELKGLINAVGLRVKAAARGYSNALHYKPAEDEHLIPPMVVSNGPDGIHTESPYGPWNPGPGQREVYAAPYESYAPKYHSNPMAVPPDGWDPNANYAMSEGGYEKLLLKTLNTVLPPLPNPYGPDPTEPPPPGALEWHAPPRTSLLASRRAAL